MKNYKNWAFIQTSGGGKGTCKQEKDTNCRILSNSVRC